MKVNSILKPMIVPGLGSVWGKALAHTIGQQVFPSNPGGFTFNPRLNRCLALEPITNSELYVVYLRGHEARISGISTGQDLLRWISGRLYLLRLENHFIGGWCREGNLYLDVSVLIRWNNAALAFGLANQQNAIYNPVPGQRLDSASPLTIAIPALRFRCRE
jgi:hypothetical protein